MFRSQDRELGALMMRSLQRASLDEVESNEASTYADSLARRYEDHTPEEIETMLEGVYINVSDQNRACTRDRHSQGD